MATTGSGNVSQGLLEDMLDPETVERMKEAQDETVFQLVDTIAPEFRCPRCGYCWRGNPLPPTNATVEDE